MQNNFQNPSHNSVAPITMEWIVTYLEQGVRFQQLERLHPLASRRRLELFKGLIAAKRPDIASKIFNRPAGADFRILVDENLSPRLPAVLRQQIGHLTHVNFEDMRGHSDPKVWNWAVENAFDGILTRDRRIVDPQNDLTAIALDAHRKNAESNTPQTLPIIIHFTGVEKTCRSLAKIFRTHATDFEENLREKKHPVILIDQEKLLTPNSNQKHNYQLSPI